MNELERRYRRLLQAYPPAYRRQHGAELLGTLMELSRPEQRRPTRREAVALLLGGLRVRAGVDGLDSAARSWLDGARTALVLMLTLQVILEIWKLVLADVPAKDLVSVQMLGAPVATTVVDGCASLALLCGSYRLGLALALLVPLPSMVPPLSTWDTGVVVAGLFWWLPVIALGVPLLRRPATTGPWRWLLPIPLMVLASTLLPLLGLFYAALLAALVSLAVCLAWAVVVDPRPAIALGVLLLTLIPQLAVSVAAVVLVVPACFAVGSVLLATGAVRVHRYVRV